MRTVTAVLSIVSLTVLFVHHLFGAPIPSESAISTESVWQSLRERRELILVDVRNGKEFEKFRIPGSLNIPLFLIKTKAFLKPKPLVLINEGHSYKELLEGYAALSNSGFAVSVLDGGLYQWREKGGPLEGDVFAQRELNRISPQTLFYGKNHENWTLIDACRSGISSDVQSLKGIHIPFSNHSEPFILKPA